MDRGTKTSWPSAFLVHGVSAVRTRGVRSATSPESPPCHSSFVPSSSPLLPPCVPPCWRVCLVVRPWGVALAPPLLHVHDNLLCDPGPLLMHAYVCPDVCNHSRRCCPTPGCCWLGCWQGEVVRCHQGLWLYHPQRWWCRSVCPSIHVRAVQVRVCQKWCVSTLV
jgi:hypothetical protein